MVYAVQNPSPFAEAAQFARLRAPVADRWAV